MIYSQTIYIHELASIINEIIEQDESVFWSFTEHFRRWALAKVLEVEIQITSNHCMNLCLKGRLIINNVPHKVVTKSWSRQLCVLAADVAIFF